MAENLLDVGPPNPKRPKLNSPALSASDGPGKEGPCLSQLTVISLTLLFLWENARLC